MRHLKLIGIGAGNPDYITVQAINALSEVDVVFVNDKGQNTAALLRARKAVCARYMLAKPYRTVALRDPVRDRAARTYRASVTDWHHARARLYAQALHENLAEGQCGAFLVWGDQSLYDSTLRILDQVAAQGQVSFDLEIIPGITSPQALAARHRIPLNQIGEPVHITTGRRLPDETFTAGANVLVMLDGDCAFRKLADQDLEIYWGAYLGTPDEILVSGRLREVGDKIVETRARARARHGWIMDTYLLCKPAPTEMSDTQTTERGDGT